MERLDLAGSFLDELLPGDKAYDSDALDQMLAQEYGIELFFRPT